MEKIQENEDEILKTYRKKFNDKELFNHLIERIGLHLPKLRKLKEDKNKKDVFLREVADVYLLTRILMKLEKVSDETIEKSSDYYLEKIEDLWLNRKN